MGPGHPDLLTLEAKKALTSIDVAIGAERFRSLDLSIPLIIPGKMIADTVDSIHQQKDKVIGVLVTGDAGFYSLAKSVIREFGKENVRVVPGISIVQTAFAKLCEPWHKAVFYSIHGRNRSAIEKIYDQERFVLLCDPKNTASSVIREISNIIKSHDIVVMENLTLENERIINIQQIEDIDLLSDASLSLIVGIKIS